MTYTIPDDDPITQRLYNHRRQAFYKIRDILPPPFEETPESYRERDLAVIESINQLIPVNAAEADLAAMAVTGNQLWIHYSRLARRNEGDAKEHTRFCAQAARSARDSKGYLIALERVQKMRIQRESTEAGAQRADIIEDNGRSLMVAALDDPPKGVQPPWQVAVPAPKVEATDPPPATPPAAPAPECQPAAAEPPAPTEAAKPEPRPAAAVLHLTPAPRVFPQPVPSRRAKAKDDDRLETDWAKEAELYAIMYPDRARLIRGHGGVPHDCRFDPPEARLARAIIAGTTPQLLALDAAAEGPRRFA